ncbi:hypothetical protein PR048_002491 [Dryococelus australis]|uniref:Uncharacterized protein n=1 Tax=Dryococelus australis TaxID=614101 RepID=A0ABQ9ILT0_9NEOP|nr:hypothetical protein PR048_002491 [Dryococelus australis]
MWGHLKALVYATPVDIVGILRNRIVAGCETIRIFPGIHQRIRVSMQQRIDACFRADGGHFEHFLYCVMALLKKVLAQKGSKRVYVATYAEKGDTVSAVACGNATGTNWIPPFVIVKATHNSAGSSFPTTGIHPYNPHIIPSIAFAPSILSEKSQLSNDLNTITGASESSQSHAASATEVGQSASPIYGTTPSFSTLINTPEITRTLPNTRKSRNVHARVPRKLSSPGTPKPVPSTSDSQTRDTSRSAANPGLDNYYGDCGGYYFDDARKNVSWIQWLKCNRWLHEKCWAGLVAKTGSSAGIKWQGKREIPEITRGLWHRLARLPLAKIQNDPGRGLALVRVGGKQAGALRLAAMGDLMRVAVSPLTLPRLSASTAVKRSRETDVLCLLLLQSVLKVSLDRPMNKFMRPAAMLILHKAEEYTTFVQVVLKQGFQKCSIYREKPVLENGHYSPALTNGGQAQRTAAARRYPGQAKNRKHIISIILNKTYQRSVSGAPLPAAGLRLSVDSRRNEAIEMQLGVPLVAFRLSTQPPATVSFRSEFRFTTADPIRRNQPAVFNKYRLPFGFKKSIIAKSVEMGDRGTNGTAPQVATYCYFCTRVGLSDQSLDRRCSGVFATRSFACDSRLRRKFVSISFTQDNQLNEYLKVGSCDVEKQQLEKISKMLPIHGIVGAMVPHGSQHFAATFPLVHVCARLIKSRPYGDSETVSSSHDPAFYTTHQNTYDLLARENLLLVVVKELLFRLLLSEAPLRKCPSLLGNHCPHADSCSTVLHFPLQRQWLDYSPPTEAKRVRFPTGRCHWREGFLGDLRNSPRLHSGTTPYSPRFTLIGSQDVKSRPNLFTHSSHTGEEDRLKSDRPGHADRTKLVFSSAFLINVTSGTTSCSSNTRQCKSRFKITVQYRSPCPTNRNVLRVLQAPSRTVAFTRRFHTLSSIHSTNTSLAVVPQSPVVVHTHAHSPDGLRQRLPAAGLRQYI